MSNITPTPVASLAGGNFHVSAFGKNWILERRADLEELWAGMGKDDFGDERIPYWTELWPASLVLGQWLCMAQSEIKERVCIDLGCGLGFTAMIGAWLGSRVIACDYELEPLRQGRRNARRNNSGQPLWLALDWRAPALGAGLAARVWAGDILYEKRSMAPVLDFLDWSLADNGTVWIAEPGRAIFKHFLDLAARRHWSAKQVFAGKAGAIYPQERAITATVWELERQ